MINGNPSEPPSASKIAQTLTATRMDTTRQSDSGEIQAAAPEQLSKNCRGLSASTFEVMFLCSQDSVMDGTR